MSTRVPANAMPAQAPVTGVDWVHRATRRVWPNFHVIVAASLPFGVLSWLVANLTPPVLIVRLGLASVFVTFPVALLIVVADRVVVPDDDARRRILKTGWATWRRLMGVVLAVAGTAVLTLIALDAWGATGAPVMLVSAVVSGASFVLAAAGGVVALPLSVEYPHARWRYLWWVSLTAVASRPVPVLGALAYLALAAFVAGRFPIALAIAPATGAVVIVAAAWTSLDSLGLCPRQGDVEREATTP